MDQKALELQKSCKCSECVSACEHTPGWFGPGEAEKAAALMGMPFEDFKNKFLGIDYWVGGANVLVPLKKGYERFGGLIVGYAYAWDHAPCVFLKDGLCSIHDAKPIECRLSVPHDHRLGDPAAMRENIQKTWADAGSPYGNNGRPPGDDEDEDDDGDE
jgi:Fe-S-cluster containining protein